MTRGNVFICDTFIGELGSDAYPGGDFWDLMVRLDGKRECSFRKSVVEFIDDKDRLPPKSSGVGNWSYEYAWFPVLEPRTKKGYRDCRNWRGKIYTRETYRMSGYYQIPGPWITLKAMARKRLSSRLRKMQANGDASGIIKLTAALQLTSLKQLSNQL